MQLRRVPRGDGGATGDKRSPRGTKIPWLSCSAGPFGKKIFGQTVDSFQNGRFQCGHSAGLAGVTVRAGRGGLADGARPTEGRSHECWRAARRGKTDRRRGPPGRTGRAAPRGGHPRVRPARAAAGSVHPLVRGQRQRGQLHPRRAGHRVRAEPVLGLARHRGRQRARHAADRAARLAGTAARRAADDPEPRAVRVLRCPACGSCSSWGSARSPGTRSTPTPA